jgi:hypothetical protein
MRIAVKLPVVVELPDLWEIESKEYAENVIDFLQFFHGRKVKYKHLGYVKRHSLVVFYTNASTAEYKKAIKDAKRDIKDWNDLMDQKDDAPGYCSICGRYEG